MTDLKATGLYSVAFLLVYLEALLPSCKVLPFNFILALEMHVVRHVVQCSLAGPEKPRPRTWVRGSSVLGGIVRALLGSRPGVVVGVLFYN